MPICVALVLLLLTVTGVGRAEDVVWLKSSAGSSGRARITGQVVDYDGRALTLSTGDGGRQIIPSDRVVRIDSPWTPPHEAANQAMDRGDFRQALASYNQAHRSEPREWVRRMILAQIVRCHRALDQTEDAVDAFLLLVNSDADTPDFDCIPLAWMPGEAVPRDTAGEWMSRTETPTAVLLGASHLMSSGQRAAAVRQLERLTTNNDPRIASLAAAQLWRSQLVTADQRQTDLWQRHLEQMPTALRAGPYLVLGRALARQQRWQEAALVLMRVPIHYGDQRDLAAPALLAAGDALASAGEADQANRLFQEVAADYHLPKWQAEVERRLRPSSEQ